MSDRIDALKNLHTTLVDSRNGYEEALEKSDGEGLEPLFRQMIDLRVEAAAQLAQHLTLLGERADDEGSFMSTVHRTVIDIRSALTGLDKSILPSLISGEERILASYDEAVAATDPGAPEYSVLLVQRDDLRGKISAMERMSAQRAA